MERARARSLSVNEVKGTEVLLEFCMSWWLAIRVNSDGRRRPSGGREGRDLVRCSETSCPNVGVAIFVRELGIGGEGDLC